MTDFLDFPAGLLIWKIPEYSIIISIVLHNSLFKDLTLFYCISKHFHIDFDEVIGFELKSMELHSPARDEFRRGWPLGV